MSSLKKDFNNKYIMALSLVGLLVISSFIVSKVFEAKKKPYPSLINISGRQRMLSQKITLSVVALNVYKSERDKKEFSEILGKDIELFKTSHEYLAQKNTGVKYEMSRVLKEHYYKKGNLDKEVSRFLNLVNSVKSLILNGEEDGEVEELIYFAKNKVLPNLDKAVHIFEDELLRMEKTEGRVDLFFTFSFFLLLGMILKLIFEPMSDFVLSNDKELKYTKSKLEEESQSFERYLVTRSKEIQEPFREIINEISEMEKRSLSPEQRKSFDKIKGCTNNLFVQFEEIFDFKNIGTEDREENLINESFSEMKVLIIDDSPISQKAIGRFIEKIGIHVEYVGDASSALKLINNGGYDLVFVDFHLPDIDGAQLTRIIKGSLGQASPTIIAVTSDDSVETTRMFFETGAAQVMTKPPSKSDILGVIERYLS